MKKLTTALLILSLFAFLTGCSTEKDETQTSYIEVVAAETGETKATLTEDREIEDFVNALKIENWSMESRPDGTVVEYEILLNIQETIKLGQDRSDIALSTGATLITYVDSDYVTLDVKGFDLDFKVPAEAAEYLHSL